MSSIALTPETTAPDRAGLIAGVVCYTLWGVLPILFAAAERSGAGAYEIVAWRTLWSIPLAVIFVMAADRGASLKTLWRSPRTLLALVLSAALIATNWTAYVWAVVHGHVLAASLGYYLNPLLNMAAGALVFRERISRTGYGAIGLAATGVLIQAASLHGPPWIPLIVAFTFCGCGIV